VAARARARWLEEYADTRLADVIVWGVFQRAVLDPGIWGKPRDLEAITRVMQEDLPPVMDYLERSLPVADFLFDPLRIGLADVAVAAPFRNLGFARQRVVRALAVLTGAGPAGLHEAAAVRGPAVRTPTSRS
jgi:glutathione S-transferase